MYPGLVLSIINPSYPIENCLSSKIFLSLVTSYCYRSGSGFGSATTLKSSPFLVPPYNFFLTHARGTRVRRKFLSVVRDRLLLPMRICIMFILLELSQLYCIWGAVGIVFSNSTNKIFRLQYVSEKSEFLHRILPSGFHPTYHNVQLALRGTQFCYHMS